MSYCAKADLVERFGVAELAQLTDETAASTPDDAEITKACDEASSYVDSYLSVRYATPLSPVPTLIRWFACDIARRILWKDRAGPESVVALASEAALARLRDIAKGVAGLPDATGNQATTTAGAIAVETADQIFTDELLGAMPG